MTGAGRGLGLAIAKKLVNDGFRVIAPAQHESEALRAALAASANGALVFAPFDLSNLEAIPAFVAALEKDYGPTYGLVNNAGLGAKVMLATMQNAEVEALIRVNLQAPILLCKYVSRQMLAEGKGGRIVNMASVVASNGYAGLSVYAATKAGLVGLTKSLARELGSMEITVNALAPGLVDTEMTAGFAAEDRARLMNRAALRRFATVQDVADAVAFLFSDSACNITGTVLTLDAGATA